MARKREGGSRGNIFAVNLGDDVAAELLTMVDNHNIGKPISERISYTDMIRLSVHDRYCRLHPQLSEEPTSATEETNHPGNGTGADQSGTTGQRSDSGQLPVDGCDKSVLPNDAGDGTGRRRAGSKRAG